MQTFINDSKFYSVVNLRLDLIFFLNEQIVSHQLIRKEQIKCFELGFYLQESYIELYELLREFGENFSDYANFK